MSVAIVIPTFAGVERLDFELKTIRENDPAAFDTPILVVEDPCDRLGVTEAYKDLCDEYHVHFQKLDAWSNMHGAASKAFTAAMEVWNPDWIIYLGDDLAITPDSISNVVQFVTENRLSTVGLVGIPYWNSHEYRDDPKSAWFYQETEWTRSVPHNPHWDGEGYSRPYVNVNGAGFACRASMYRSVGGFAEGTWCLDESLSYRCWTQSPYSIVTLPGPPTVHYFGGATLSKPPHHNLHTFEAWEAAIGHSKSECDQIMRKAMGEREEKCLEEMRAAKYYGDTMPRCPRCGRQSPMTCEGYYSCGECGNDFDA